MRQETKTNETTTLKREKEIMEEREIIEERESSTETQRNIKGLGSYVKHGRAISYPGQRKRKVSMT